MRNFNCKKFWMDSMEGKEVYIHEGLPQYGFYKKRRCKNGPWDPVAIWHDGEKYVALVGEKECAPEEVWTYCADKPITYEVYKKAMDLGHFPGEIARGVGDNGGPSIEGFSEEFLKLSELAEGLSLIRERETADLAANIRDRINNLHKRIVSQRKSESSYFEENLDRIRKNYLILESVAKQKAEIIREFLTDFLISNPDVSKVGGQFGKRVSLRKINKGEIEDYEKFVSSVINEGTEEANKLKNFLCSLADSIARQGKELEGMKIIERMVAV